MRTDGLSKAWRGVIKQVRDASTAASKKRLSGPMVLEVHLKDGGPARTDLRLPLEGRN